MLQEFKIDTFDKKIAELPDVPQLSAGELKACFDAPPEQLRQSLNGAIDALANETGAAQIGFQQSPSVHAGTVQEAIENVQGQIKNVAIGQIPEGSVSTEMLAEDVMLKFADLDQKRQDGDRALETQCESGRQALQNAVDSVASQVTAVNSSLTKKINTVSSTVNAKVSLYTGEYTGNNSNGTNSQTINLGYQPKMVFLYNHGNGIDRNFLIQGVNQITAWITSNGFAVKSSTYNNNGTKYGFVALR